MWLFSGDCHSTAEDSSIGLPGQSSQPFTTVDRDNDQPFSEKCEANFHGCCGLGNANLNNYGHCNQPRLVKGAS